MMKSLFFLVQLAGIAVAANDWSRACHGGQCAWDVPALSVQDGSASLQLWSTSPSAIADITPAAGWAILTCSGSAAAQTVRIACTDPSFGCSHLLDTKTNPMGRIVRLTDECGTMPFARIASMRLADDQMLPSVLSRRAAPPAVYEVALDTEFGASGSEHGTVSFALTASSRPEVRAGTVERVPRGRFQPRGFADEQEQLSKRAYMADGIRELTTRDDGNTINLSNSTSFPVNINKTNLNVFNTTINCQSASIPFDASVKADVDAVADAQFTLGIVATGTIIPPQLNTAAITAGMTGSIDGALRVQASADGTFSSPSITLLDLPLPGGIVIPGILQLGPAFKVVASANAVLGTAIDTTVGLSYKVKNATLVFPPDQGPSGGTFTPNETPLQISTDTNVTGSVSLTGHLIPELVIGIDAFEGLVQSSVTLSLDASATIAVNGTAGLTDSSNSSAIITAQGACVDVSTALAVSASASADLFDIFNTGVSVSLFDKSFDLFNTCTDSSDTNSTSSSNSTSVNTGSVESSTSGMNSTYGMNSTSSGSGSDSSSYSSSDDCIASCSMSYGLTMSSSSSAAASTQTASGYGSSSYSSEPSSYSSGNSSSSESSSSMYYWSARAIPIPVDVPRAVPVEVWSLGKRDTLSCPSLPFTIHAPTGTSKTTPKAATS
ncbi:hypothetical protein PENSPDRAFT_748414 [Peniophora sp. CONT]|nr:hypothetical protein PENSPDRAFT_748414 [Peniophora sp. CONT]